jgi:hypothetical protein
MTNLRETIDHYHSLLDPETARETHEQLTEQLLRRGLFFGDRPLSTVLHASFTLISIALYKLRFTQ